MIYREAFDQLGNPVTAPRRRQLRKLVQWLLITAVWVAVMAWRMGVPQ